LWLVEFHRCAPDDIDQQPAGRIEFIYQPRTFTAFGATGKVSGISFQITNLTLAEALARIGGPLDQQTDPTGVFIFRGRQASNVIPIVYRLNLKDPIGYFAAPNFDVSKKYVHYSKINN
jgi:polysaccharide export outer membrane protein